MYYKKGLRALVMSRHSEEITNNSEFSVRG